MHKKTCTFHKNGIICKNAVKAEGEVQSYRQTINPQTYGTEKSVSAGRDDGTAEYSRNGIGPECRNYFYCDISGLLYFGKGE